MRIALVFLLLAGIVMQSGCASLTPEEQSTLIGAGIGAGLGSVLGNNFGGSRNDRELGMAAGALVGGMLGNQSAKQSAMQQQINAVQQQQFVTTVWVENSNGSKTPVVLRQTEGGQYIGPRGEYYSTMPTQDQLKQVYGM
jgi:uncharacterized protein YcfJ